MEVEWEPSQNTALRNRNKTVWNFDTESLGESRSPCVQIALNIESIAGNYQVLKGCGQFLKLSAYPFKMYEGTLEEMLGSSYRFELIICQICVSFCFECPYAMFLYIRMV